MLANLHIQPLDPVARQELELVVAGAYAPRNDDEKAVVLTAPDRLEFDNMLRHQQSAFAGTELIIPDSPPERDDYEGSPTQVAPEEAVEKVKDPTYDPTEDVQVVPNIEHPPVTPYKKPHKQTTPRQKKKTKPEASSPAESVASSAEPDPESAVPFDQWEEFRYVGKDNTLVLFQLFFPSHLLVDVSIPVV